MERNPPAPFLGTDSTSPEKVWQEASNATSDPPWPAPGAWTEVSSRPQFTNRRARCTRIAVCDHRGQPASRFLQGEQAHFFAEFEIFEDISLPSGTLGLVNEAAVLAHGKATYQAGSDLPPPLHAGERVRFHWSVELRLSIGEYSFSVQLAEADPESYQGYLVGALSFPEFSHRVKKHCRLEIADSFEVTWGPQGKLSHHGIADLPGFAQARVVEGQSSPLPTPVLARDAEQKGAPTVFHITHWKAGSQWIHKILRQCCPETIVIPEVDQLWHNPVQPGRVYPTVYMSKQEFAQVPLPDGSTRFVVIRDLRDTLVSAYFSIKFSHPAIPGFSLKLRQLLQDSDIETGTAHLMDHFLEKCAAIQLSWLEAGDELVLKYEDLLANDLSLLEFALIEHCRLPIKREALRDAVLAARFEALTGGRVPGVEDLSAHERKGIAGDWRNHFTEKIKRAFKARYGGLLVASGYEADLSW